MSGARNTERIKYSPYHFYLVWVFFVFPFCLLLCYEHLGFVTYKRTDLDEEGNPYPLLYMKRTK